MKKKGFIILLFGLVGFLGLACSWNNGSGGEREGPDCPDIGKNIGDDYGGGKVAYCHPTGGGLIAATSDQSTGAGWGCYGIAIGQTSTAYGKGLANTNHIIAQSCSDSSHAAYIARAYDGGGHNDWFLPSFDELNHLYQNKEAIGDFATSGAWSWYWSSSEYNSYSSWDQCFSGDDQNNTLKVGTGRVRSVRVF